MHDAGERLTAIGFARPRLEKPCWRHVRLARPRQNIEAEPTCSAELLRWRELLRREDRPSPYRISRIAS